METGTNKWRRLKKIVIFLFCILLYFIVIMGILPIKEDLQPCITAIQDEIFIGEGVSEIRNGVTFTGRNLDLIDAIYINGKRNAQCSIIESSSKKIVMDIPKDVYQNEATFFVQVEKRIGGGYKLKSKKCEVRVNRVMSTMPHIIGVSQDMLYHSNKPQKLILTVENIDEDCNVYVNGKEAKASFDYNNDLIGLYISQDMYDQRNSIELVIAKKLSELQMLYGHVFEIKIQDIDYKEYQHSYNFVEEAPFIMHGAGEWNGYTYTNCLEAFESNYQKGCKVFEIDFMLTSDGVIVGRHDWTTIMYDKQLVAEDEVLLESYKRNNLPKSFEEVCEMYKGRTPLTWSTLLSYLVADESLYIITDTKYSNDIATGYIFGRMVEIAKKSGMEGVLDRIVVQVYNQDMYRKVMEIYPFKSVIYTLYQSSDSNEMVLEFIEHSNVGVITLPLNSGRDDDVFFDQLKKRGCYIFVHTINDISVAASYFARGCDGIYTDSIRLDQMEQLKTEIMKIKANMVEKDILLDSLQEEKTYLLNYLREIKNEDYLILMCIQDEATIMVDDEIATVLCNLGVSADYRHAYRQSYLGIMNNGNAIYEAFSEDLSEYTYIDEQNIFELRSAGNGIEQQASIIVDGVEQISVYERGLHIVVFNKKLGIVEDRIVFDLYDGLVHSNY